MRKKILHLLLFLCFFIPNIHGIISKVDILEKGDQTIFLYSDWHLMYDEHYIHNVPLNLCATQQAYVIQEEIKKSIASEKPFLFLAEKAKYSGVCPAQSVLLSLLLNENVVDIDETRSAEDFEIATTGEISLHSFMLNRNAFKEKLLTIRRNNEDILGPILNPIYKSILGEESLAVILPSILKHTKRMFLCSTMLFCPEIETIYQILKEENSKKNIVVFAGSYHIGSIKLILEKLEYKTTLSQGHCDCSDAVNNATVLGPFFFIPQLCLFNDEHLRSLMRSYVVSPEKESSPLKMMISSPDVSFLFQLTLLNEIILNGTPDAKEDLLSLIWSINPRSLEPCTAKIIETAQERLSPEVARSPSPIFLRPSSPFGF
ncbi:hypothetical protein HN446_04615 [bacterium]|nr:hypothetical protein [bacterium]